MRFYVIYTFHKFAVHLVICSQNLIDLLIINFFSIFLLGQVTESEEMAPKWFNEMPYDKVILPYRCIFLSNTWFQHIFNFNEFMKKCFAKNFKLKKCW